jgi:hypothetical protein
MKFKRRHGTFNQERALSQTSLGSDSRADTLGLPLAAVARLCSEPETPFVTRGVFCSENLFVTRGVRNPRPHCILYTMHGEPKIH